MPTASRSTRSWPILLALLAAACAQIGNPAGPGSNRAPLIRSVTLTPGLVPIGGQALVEVDASDPDGDAVFYRYQATSGTVEPEAERPWRARYVNDGSAGNDTDRIVATVVDTRNAQSVFTANLTLQGNRPPDLRLPDAEACHPTCRGPFDDCRALCRLNFHALVSDPEGQALTYQWSGCVNDSDGPNATCNVSEPGLYAVNLTVRDARGGTSVATAKGQGTNRPPAVTGGGNIAAVERRLLIDARDPDGDPVRCAWRGTCQCTGDTQSSNLNCAIPPGLGSCFEEATCFDPFGARGQTEFQMVRP